MHPLDFISDSPTFFILQKESNKTNFGGFLILFYGIGMLLICIYYSLKYINDDKYTFNSITHFNLKSEEEKQERDRSSLYNPNTKFELLLLGRNKTKLTDKMKFYDPKNNHLFNNTYNSASFDTKISEFDIYIVYDCETSNCSDYFDYINNLNESEQNYYLYTFYQGFKLDHQNPNEPILKEENGTEISFYTINGLIHNITNSLRYYWQIILYNEKKLFSEDYNNSCGYISDYALYNNILETKVIGGKNYVILNKISINNRYTEYIEYKRTRNSELDLIANIFSLFSNFFFILRIVFKFYSKNFNNYKVIENILSNKLKNNIVKNNKSKNKSLELENFLNENNNVGNNKFMPLSSDFETTEKFFDDKDKDIHIDSYDNDNKINLKKLHFYDFYFNYLYCNKCCIKNKAQGIINSCNKILYKYASIDNIVYNQILLENLFKDYKWNDPKLNNVENNSLFNELKTYLYY